MSDCREGTLLEAVKDREEVIGAALRGVAGLPVRVKCATLAWHALLKEIGEAAS